MVGRKPSHRGRKKTAGSVRKAPRVDDLESAEAFEVLRRLARTPGAVGKAVRDEIRAIVSQIDMEGVAAEVYYALEDLAVEDLWDRSGRSVHGYRHPPEEAWTMIEEVIQPYIARIEQYRRWGMNEQARDYCVQVLEGIFQYDRDADTEFKNWAPDDAGEAAAWVWDSWKEGERDPKAMERMEREFVRRFRPT